jgi:hypothetical protein
MASPRSDGSAAKPHHSADDDGLNLNLSVFTNVAPAASPRRRPSWGSFSSFSSPDNWQSDAPDGTVAEALILPMDYSGQVAQQPSAALLASLGDVAGNGSAGGLLAQGIAAAGQSPADPPADGAGAGKTALQTKLSAQLAVCGCRDDALLVLHRFRHELALQPMSNHAEAVQEEQSVKDAAREEISVNGKLVRQSVKLLRAELLKRVGSFVPDRALRREVASDIIRAASRTANGGDTYMALLELLPRGGGGGAGADGLGDCPRMHMLLTPSSEPLHRDEWGHEWGDEWTPPGEGGGGDGGGEGGDAKGRGDGGGGEVDSSDDGDGEGDDGESDHGSGSDQVVRRGE